MFALLCLISVLVVPSVHGLLYRAHTPPMGWNTYNAYTCDIDENKVKMNAQALVDLGLRDLGYTLVTTDCAWNARERDSQGKMQWNASTFPSGGKALGDFLHARGLKFGMYSGAGYKQCNPWEITGSRDHEDIDAQSFADWGADALKYDNCYMADPHVINGNSPEYSNPQWHQKMSVSLDKVARNISYGVCQWGNGDNVGHWAAKIANTYRISGDIQKDWESIWRISNQVAPYHGLGETRPGTFPDMDMLIIGINALTPEEERFHFKMWAINKSPLVIGAVLDDKFPKHSLETLSKKEIIAINQDPDGNPANLVRRYTEEEWDVWYGVLSGGRAVLGIANWKQEGRTVQFDLQSLDIKSASVRDPWQEKDISVRSGVQTFDLNAHELKLWILSDIKKTNNPRTPTVYHYPPNATLTGRAVLNDCTNQATCEFPTRVRYIGPGSTASFSVSVTTPGTKVMGIDFVQYDHSNNNIRMINIAINGGPPKRWAVPLSGQSWDECWTLNIDVPGFKSGENTVVFSGVEDAWGPDLVGFNVYE